MNFLCAREGKENLEYGEGRLTARGLFGQDTTEGRRQLTFDLFLTGFRNQGVFAGNLNTFPIIPQVRFNICPDRPYSLIGKGVWDNWRDEITKKAPKMRNAPKGGLPPYEDIMKGHTSAKLSNTVYEGGLLSWLRVAIASPHFSWGRTVPEFHIGIGSRLPSDMCCLGSDFLKHGILCWVASDALRKGLGCTFFFPPQSDEEVWPINDRFHQPNTSAT